MDSVHNRKILQVVFCLFRIEHVKDQGLRILLNGTNKGKEVTSLSGEAKELLSSLRINQW